MRAVVAALALTFVAAASAQAPPWWKCKGEAAPRSEEEDVRLVEFLERRFAAEAYGGAGENLSRANLVKRFGPPQKTQSKKARRGRNFDFGEPVVITTWEFPGIELTTAARQSSPAAHSIVAGAAFDGQVDLGQGLAVGQTIEQWSRVIGRPHDCRADGRLGY